MSTRFRIERLGVQGDGVADGPAGAVFIPYALPGETVTAAVERDRGTLIAVLDPSPQRSEPACRHFGTCGGCALQHWERDAYQEWKRGLVGMALQSRGIGADIAPLVPCAPHTRRRAAFSTRRSSGGMVLGFNRAQSSDIVPLEECPVLLPQIAERLPMLRKLAGIVCSCGDKPFRMLVTATASGLDVAVSDQGRLDENARRLASSFALAEDLARVSADGEIVIEPHKPMIDFGGVGVSPPPGAFLQATAAAEQAMVELVLAHLSPAKRVADLFSGCGSFALRLARKAEVHAVESDAAALAALDRGFRFAGGLRKVTHERRDLFRRPLTAKELTAFGGVVFDPPRAGAEEQATQIARSEVPLVAAVSCNPATLARDLRIIVDGGYRLKSVTPIDQFLWSPHVEAVALLEKPRKRR
ncbi:MAG: class I SAM-dependent RNA methyltransferase [Rhizobiaceae bacterium]|nr:class I SAM-dependent RNA methyltransferase [Rhizobiaceae bacterium]